MRMQRELPRRRIFSAGLAATLLAAACGSVRRQSGRLTYLLRREPDTLDPAKTPGGSEGWIIPALFEPLLEAHPVTMAPMAGLATHFKVDRGGMRYTFYLRGSQSPDGIALPGADSLPAEFSHGCSAAPFDVPAVWSDGTPITAYDIVFSWRRYLTPETGSPNAWMLYCVAGAEAVVSGKTPADQLGVRALDALTFQVDLRAPAPEFLMICYQSMTVPMPQHAIEAARHRGHEASWIEPGRMVTSGPFFLKESRPRERTVITKNPNYFDAALLGMQEIEFSVADGAAVVNLFQVWLADSMEGRALPLQLAPLLRDRREFHVRPGAACHNWRISAKRPPLDNRIRRYALNMATDKDSTVRFLGTGQAAAKSRVPPWDGYRSPQTLPVEVNGQTRDVLAYDPRAARELWASASSAESRGPLSIHYPARVNSVLLAEILQQQWRENLGIATRLMPMEPAAYVQSVLNDGEFDGVAEDTWFGGYPDPYDALSIYTAWPNWSDPAFDAALVAATSTPDPALRMEKLAACETMLLRDMPFVPLYFDTWVYLERPEIHGLSLSPLGIPAFKYAWIDTDSRPQ